MTYPDDPNGLVSQGMFLQSGKSADDLRAKLAATTMQWFHQCQSDRQKVERQWYLNLAFYRGQQYVQFRNAGNGNFDLYVPNAPYWRVRIVINQIRKIIRKEISRLTAQKPNAFIIPSTTEDADVFAAQAGEQIWDSLWREKKFNRILRESVFWQAVCGNGFIKTTWDAAKEDPHNPNVAGDISIENISPFYIFVPNLLATEIEDQPYVIHAQVRSKSWIFQNFGVTLEDNTLESVDESMRNVLEVNRDNSKKDTAIVLEVWVKPKFLPELPNGGVLTVVGNQVVQGWDEWPYEHKQYPFAKLDATLSGTFYNSSIIEDLIPLQKELNRSRGQLIESKNKMSKPQLVAPKGSVNAKRITTEPGQVIEYELGFDPPQPLPIQNLPNYVTEEIDRLYTDMADLSGQHEVSNGSTPPGVTAATAISFLQEQDEGLVAPNYSSIEEAIEKVATHSLILVKMYWDEQRTVKITGLDGTFDVQTFKGSDLRGNTDIRVESGSALPTSRAAKQAFIMDLMTNGFVPPEEGLEILEIGGINKIYERIQVDKRQAQRENLKMRIITEEDIQMHQEAWMTQQMQGDEVTKDVDSPLNLAPPPIVTVNTWDNHEVHIEVHNNYRKTQAFEGADPVTKRLFEEHVRMHQDAMAGLLTHPLTGMSPSDPNAPELGAEESIEEGMIEEEKQTGEGGTTGPVPMPETQTGGEML